MSHEDQIIKVCEINLIDDDAEYKKLSPCEKRYSLINKVKENSYKLIQLYAQVAKTENRILMNHAIRINQMSEQDPVKMLFLIAYIIRYSNRE